MTSYLVGYCGRKLVSASAVPIPATPSSHVVAQPEQERARRQRSECKIISHCERIERITQCVVAFEVGADEVDDNQQDASS